MNRTEHFCQSHFIVVTSDYSFIPHKTRKVFKKTIVQYMGFQKNVKTQNIFGNICHLKI